MTVWDRLADYNHGSMTFGTNFINGHEHGQSDEHGRRQGGWRQVRR